MIHNSVIKQCNAELCSRLALIFFLSLAGLYGALYWILSLIYWPDAPFSTIVHYHIGGDIELWPVITRSWGSGFGEVGLYETFGKGLISFPYISLLPYMVSYQLFGNAGFVVADIAVSVFRFYALFLVVQFFIPKKNTALFVAFILFSIFLCGSLPLAFRIHRGYVTIGFFWLALYSLLKVNAELRNNALSNRTGLFHGISCALLFQGDLYSGIALLLATFFIGFYDLIKKPQIRKAWLISGAVFVLLNVTSLIQFFYRKPELLERVSGFKPDILVLQPISLAMMASTIIFFLTAALCRNSKRFSAEPLIVALNTFGVLLIAAMVAGYIYLSVVDFSLVYSDEAEMQVLVFVATLFLYLGGLIYLSIRDLPRQQDKRLCVGAFIVLLGVLAMTVISDQKSWIEAHVQPCVWVKEGYGKAVPDYRENFIALAQELENPRYNNCTVLGTLDYDLEQWWVAFHQGYSYLAIPGLSYVSNHDIEERLWSFAQLVGIPAVQFLELLNQPVFQVRFHLNNTYLASRYHLYADPGDYSKESLVEAWKSRDIWHLSVPEKEAKRIKEEYEKTRGLVGRLDMIIIPASLLPDITYTMPKGYEQTYANNVFVVWKRQGCERSDQPK